MLTVAAIATVTAWPAVANAQRVCWPGVKVPPVEIPAISIPAREIPAREIPAREIKVPPIPGRVAPTIPTITIPAVTIPAVSIPPFTVPGYTVPEKCFDSEKNHALPPSKTSVRVRNYHRIDSNFSLALSVAYWRQTGSSSLVPDHSAEGFGESTAAGFAKNQYVRAYIRTDGTSVPGHWRHGTRDGRPTCKFIRCKVKAAG